MFDPAAPDPAQIQRGSVALTTALQISTLLPGEQDAIFSILPAVNQATIQYRSLANTPHTRNIALRIIPIFGTSA